jgi:hypothetical protein
MKRGQWLGASNRYRRNCIQRLDDDTFAGNVKCLHLRQYIAASGFVHCADGWSLLGRSVDAYSRGDVSAAVHFAYYAELRGAMSFLATRGIGIFSNRHYVIDASSTCTLIPKNATNRYPGTHQITWLALEHWADQAKSSNFLFQVISPSNIKLSDWFQHFHRGTVAAKPLARKWLKAWGLDLKYLSEDRDARNEVSYRPSDLVSTARLDAIAASEFLSDFWSALEPSASRFEIIDRYLLRMSLEAAFKARTNQAALGNSQFENEVDQMLDSLNPPGPKIQWLEFLTRRADPKDLALVQFASTISGSTSAIYHLEVISRAALLLRTATGACDMLRKQSMLTRTDLDFWWSEIGLRRGLWQPSAQPTNCSDLWSDVDAAIKDEATWQSINRATTPSFFKWRTDQIAGLSVLGECERVALWGLGL